MLCSIKTLASPEVSCADERADALEPSSPIITHFATKLTETHSCGLACESRNPGSCQDTPHPVAPAVAQHKAQSRTVILQQTTSLLGWPVLGFFLK